MKLSRKKYIHDKDKAESKQILFCSECGDELEFFGVSEKEINIEKVKERYHTCKEKGKFKGDKCAMLFIAEPNEDSEADEEEH
ncbi:MAG: hypothetical protein FJ214_03420 [Ignavibacteria bacterium]|nr:hypothetical protein [Ignavibacteria bacterium]